MIKSGHHTAMVAVAAMLGFALWPSAPASALTMKECSAKYDAAKKAGTLKGAKWNDFRKAECGTDATSAAAPAAAPAAATKPAAAAAKPASASAAVFPKAVDPKFAKEAVGKARLHTCSEQYNANKASNANGGMKWIEKGGGYWSACNKALKGA